MVWLLSQRRRHVPWRRTVADEIALQAVFAVAGGLALLAWGCNLRMARAEREAAGSAPV